MNNTRKASQPPHHAQAVQAQTNQNQNSLYSRIVVSRKITLPVYSIGHNLKETLQSIIQHDMEGKCAPQGFIQSNSVQILTHSSGLIVQGNQVMFDVSVECNACFPVEGMMIAGTVKSVDKAGICAVSAIVVPSPVTIFILKEHHQKSMDLFTNTKVGDPLLVKVIGHRFEINDPFITVIGEIKTREIKTRENHASATSHKPRTKKKSG
jgi:DNA-directed RNA polymerase subunit E'/Rpb7